MLGNRVRSAVFAVLVVGGGCTAYTSVAPDAEGGEGGGGAGDAAGPGARPDASSASSGAPPGDGGRTEDAEADGGPDATPPAPRADLERANWRMPNSTGSGLPHPPSYQVSNGMVVDDVTGLVWQQAASAAPVGYSTALASCDALELGGRSDWRLPTATELFSVVDLGYADPSALVSAFPNIPAAGEAGWFWTSTRDVAEQNRDERWAIQFRAGGGYSNTWPLATACTVRCVSGTAPPDQPRIVPVSTGIVRDTFTELVWMAQAIAGPFTFAGAFDACAGVTLGGFAWRVPSMKELETLVDRHRSGPALDAAFTTGVIPAKLWSSSLLTDYAGSAWLLDAVLGHAVRVDDTDSASVQCVH